MKKIICILIIIPIFLLSSCVSSDKNDINEFVKAYNGLTNSKISSDEFIVTYDNEYYVYSHKINSDTYLYLYSDKEGCIVQATLTSSNTEFEKLKSIATPVIQIITSISTKEIKKLITMNKSNTLSVFMITHISYDQGQTIIVNNENNELNTNNNPTLKNYIDEKDVSRPVYSETTTNNKTTDNHIIN